MREMKYLKVSADIARRAGVIDVRHRTADGNFIVNESDLRMVRFEPEEYVRDFRAGSYRAGSGQANRSGWKSNRRGNLK